MRLLSGVLVVALALAGCGGSGKGASPSAAATASWTGPLLVYTKQVRETETTDRLWPAIEVVTYDIGAKRKVASFEIGGVGEYPSEVVTAGNKIVANLEQRAVMYDIDGSSPRVLREAAPGGYVIGIGASADGTKLALTEARAGAQGGDWVTGTDIVVLDIASGEEILTVQQSAPGFAGFIGQAGTITWRDDGSGFVVQGYTYSEYPGGTSTVMLDGSVRTHALQDWVLAAPDGRYVEHGARAPVCESIGKSEIVLRDLDSEADLASVQGEGSILVPREWSPDSKELLYSAYAALPADGREWCSLRPDPASESWYILRVDGSPPEPVSDVRAVYQRWYGDQHVRFRCLGEFRRDRWCSDEQGRMQPVEVWVGDTMVGSGVEVEVVGFIDR